MLKTIGFCCVEITVGFPSSLHSYVAPVTVPANKVASPPGHIGPLFVAVDSGNSLTTTGVGSDSGEAQPSTVTSTV